MFILVEMKQVTENLIKVIQKVLTECRFVILWNPTAVSNQINIVNILIGSYVLSHLKLQWQRT